MSDAALQDRATHFANENFVIGVLQVVSAGSLVSALSQFPNLVKLVSIYPYLGFISIMTGGLISAVLSAYYKHEYKMWDIKLRGSVASQDPEEEIERRMKLVQDNLAAMRRALAFSMVLIVTALAGFVIAAWLVAPYQINDMK